MKMLKIEPLEGIQYPYVPTAKNYLSESDANIKDFFVFMQSPCSPITVKWHFSSKEVTSFAVEYATKPDYSDAIVKILPADIRSLDLSNLYKSTNYYVRVTALGGESNLSSDSTQFVTSSLGPRVMNVDGIYNVRDLGGYLTDSRKTSLQGLLYRGGSLTPADVYDSNLSDDGKKYMSEQMGIKTEIDLRSPEEAGNISQSVLPHTALFYIPLGSYASAFTDSTVGKDAYKRFFSVISDKKNYPIYYHCTGGADRTGTVSFLLNALLGVDESTLIKDYEFTGFSIYHMRNTKEGEYASFFKEFRDRLNSFDGKTVKDKTENYLLSIGVTKTEINNIRAIMTSRSN